MPAILPAFPARARVVAGATILAICVALLTWAATARAASPRAPGNDNRDAATSIPSLPATVSGTTVGATLQATEPDSGCASISASVWYAVTVGTAPPSRIGIKLHAEGDLDAAVDVYVRQRSQSEQVICRQTDKTGHLALAFTPEAGTTYLIRVGQRSNSDAGTFSMRVFPLPPPPAPPGRPLSTHGADGLLDGTLATSAAYSMRLTAGTTYKINLVKPNEGCMRLQIFPPKTKSFDAGTPAAGLSCGGYRLFTPKVSGVWSFLILADENNPGTQAYGLHVAPATYKEMAPGIFLPNLSHYKGYLHGNVIDAVRLFRFDVTSHSDLTLFLEAASNAPFDLKLLDDQGHYLQCNCGSTGEETIRRQIRPGRYFAVVQAEDFGSGPFTLYRQTRLITHIHTTMDGFGYEQVSPGRAVRIDARITPAVSGPVTIEVQRFDPVERWQFYRTYNLTAFNGLASLGFVPPHIGRWRASSVFNGTRTASPASSGVAQILVAGPLQQ